MILPVAEQAGLTTEGSWTELTEMALAMLPPEALAAAGAGIVVGLLGFLLLGGKKKPRRQKGPGAVLESLRSKAEEVDLCIRRNGVVDPLGVCMVERVDKDGILCRFAGGFDPAVFREGRKLAMVFNSRLLDGRKVNALPCSVIKFTLQGGSPGVLLSMPEQAIYIKRRQHQRKRVTDQQFVRVRLWLADPQHTDIDFHSARPNISVNAFDNGNGPEADNKVINLSPGGMALSINTDTPGNFSTGQPVTLNLALFSFRDKTFKDHWYAGSIRNIKDMENGRLRLGIGFLRFGLPGDTDADPFTWHAMNG